MIKHVLIVIENNFAGLLEGKVTCISLVSCIRCPVSLGRTVLGRLEGGRVHTRKFSVSAGLHVPQCKVDCYEEQELDGLRPVLLSDV